MTTAETKLRYYERNRAALLAQKRDFHARNRETARANRKAKYARDRNKELERAANRRAANPGMFRRWSEANPSRALFHRAKLLISKATGLAISAIPDDLVWAKAEEIKIKRWLRSAIAGDTRSAETPKSDSAQRVSTRAGTASPESPSR